MELLVLLHNIRSAHNVGSILRTADAACVSRVYLTGYTPTPKDRFGRAQKDIAKTALGAEMSVPWEYQKTPGKIIRTLRDEHCHIVAVEQNSDSIDYRKFRGKKSVLFIFGNEVNGVSKSILRSCDEIVEIPMHGTKESLNVSVAAGIILFQAIST
jgi:23S rRNA (guanosine2251-2'-O)-methyltransferase